MGGCLGRKAHTKNQKAYQQPERPVKAYSNLSKAIDQLLENISNGTVIISKYKQMKMYNDESLNPELYSKDD